MPLHLTLALGDNELTRSLADGSVRPEGVDLTVLCLPAPERHWRMGRHMEFDAAEFSLAAYLVAHSQGSPLQALPIFPLRRFRHGFVFVRAEAGISVPADLNGRRVGLRVLGNTASLWARGILAEHYGVDLRSIQWFTQDAESHELGGPPALSVQPLTAAPNVDAALVEGAIDAAITPTILPSFVRGSLRVRRLFPNYRDDEIAYYRSTGMFPLMHTVVVQRDLLSEHPWLASSLVAAFEAAKGAAYRRLENPRILPYAWFTQALAEQRALMGPDPWPYTLDANRATIETLIRYAHEQGLIPQPPRPDELFVPVA